MTDLVQFRARFPEFATVADARVQVYLDDAIVFENEDAWGDVYPQAVLYYAAHCLQLAEEVSQASAGGEVATSGPGALASATVDGESVGFATPQKAVSGSDFETQLFKTPYGQKYLELRSRVCSSIALAGTFSVRGRFTFI